jgi:hypothetical protein
VSQNTFLENWDAIFNKEKQMLVRVDEQKEIGACGCGRSPTGKCIGWHGLTESEFQAQLASFMAEQEDKGAE